MAIQIIGIGSAADDGTGDPLRTAFSKANDNFDELYTLLGSGGTLPTLTNGRLVVGAAAGVGDFANLTYSEASGPRLQVGTTGTSAGVIIGYDTSAGSGYSLVKHAGLANGAANHALRMLTDATQVNSPGAAGTLDLAVNNAAKMRFLATAGVGPSILAGTATTDVNALSATQTWNASGVTFTGIKYTITDTASAAGSLAMRILGGASGTTNLFSVKKDGRLIGNSAADMDFESGTSTNFRFYRSGTLSFVIGAGAVNLGSSADASIGRAGANLLVFGGSGAAGGDATSRAEINKTVTAFTDGVAKTVFTLTIPNAAHSATYEITVCGAIGAGGAIGADEASATNKYQVTIARTAGVNAVAGISAAFGASTAAVAGATTVTCTAALAAVSGAVGATNTIDIQATITKGGGSSDNHTCVATASLLNANASGITIA